MPQLDRITQDPAVMGGKPCIRGMRVTVGMVVGQIGAGHTIEQVLADYPYLEREDVLQALRSARFRISRGRASDARQNPSVPRCSIYLQRTDPSALLILQRVLHGSVQPARRQVSFNPAINRSRPRVFIEP